MGSILTAAVVPLLAAVNKRSPILGYNHNFKHRGVVFHVQTEDSGVDNPHIFTHLFHGGVILESRKLVYDAEAAESAVKSLMQAQHKSIAKGLRTGAYDDKIDLYLASNKDLLPRRDGSVATEKVPPVSKPAPVVTRPSEPSRPPSASPSSSSRPAPPLQRNAPARIKMPTIPPQSQARKNVRAVAAGSASDASAPDMASGQYHMQPAQPPTDVSNADTAPLERIARRSNTVRDLPVLSRRGGLLSESIASVAAKASTSLGPKVTQQFASRSSEAQVHGRPVTPMRAVTEAPIVPDGQARPLGKRGKSAPVTASNVIVSGNSVVGGKKSQSQGDNSLFGREVISERSLDDVIMAYLGESE